MSPMRAHRNLLGSITVVAWLLFGLVPAAAAPVQPSGPDWGWLFDDGAGTAAAASFGSESGLLVGDARFDGDSAFSYAGNGSLFLDGSGDYAEMSGLNGALNGQAAFTVSMWLRSSGTGVNRAFFGGANPDNADRFGGRYDESGWLNGNGGTKNLIKFGIHIDGVNYQYESAGNHQTTDWQHVVFTWESGLGASLYIDGVLDTASSVSAGIDRTGSPTSGTLSNQSRFLVGNGAKAPWSGRIDEALVWTSALSNDEVQWLSANSAQNLVAEPGTLLLGALGALGLARIGRERHADPSLQERVVA